MKKIFFLAAAMAASMSLMAQVEFHYLPTVGDKNAAGTEFNKSDKVEVAADELFIAGENFEVYNAYKTTYKAVGMVTDTAYSHLKIGDVVVDYNKERIQGQDNPTAGGANPVVDMACPTQGACYKVKVKKDGYLYVAVKSTPNKQQFAFEGVAEANGVIAGTYVGFKYLTMSVNPKENDPIGNPDGAIMVEYKGEPTYNQLLSSAPMPYAVVRDGSYSTSGIGVLTLPVYADAETYIVGTAGSKMMACGFAFSENPVEVVALGSEVVMEDATTKKYDDVVLTNEANITVFDCSKDPIMLKVSIPEEEKSEEAIWNKVDSVGKAAVNMSAWVWADGVNGSFRTMVKSGNNFVLQIDDLTQFNVLFVSGKVDSWDGIKPHAQTEDVNNVTADGCYKITNFDPANAEQKCKAVAVDCLTGDELTGIADVVADGEAKAVKVIENGQLIIIKVGVKYNVLGTVVE